MAVTIGYIGATGRDIGYFGTDGSDTGEAININQIDPAVARAAFPGPNGTWNAAALRASVPNPFFGVAGAGEFASSPTIQAGQLLRPFPQFGDVFMFEKTDGGRAAVSTPPPSCSTSARPGWWGGRFSYTLSQTKDNQFGQGSTYPDHVRDAAEQLRPRCRIRHQQLRLAAPDHPGADRQVPGARRAAAAPRGCCSAGGAHQRSSSW